MSAASKRRRAAVELANLSLWISLALLVVTPASAAGLTPDRDDRDLTVPGAAPDTGERISRDFTDADIVNVIRILPDVGGENVVVPDDVKGRVTLRLVDVPWEPSHRRP